MGDLLNFIIINGATPYLHLHPHLRTFSSVTASVGLGYLDNKLPLARINFPIALKSSSMYSHHIFMGLLWCGFQYLINLGALLGFILSMCAAHLKCCNSINVTITFYYQHILAFPHHQYPFYACILTTGQMMVL